MTLFINSQIFDFAIIPSSTKLSVPLVSSVIEELKIISPSKAVTQSKWLELMSSKINVSEAQCFWSMFSAARATLLNQFGDWIDLPSLGLLMICQCFPNARIRADSFHRSEIIAQSLAVSAISTSASPPIQNIASSRVTSRINIANTAKLVRDNSSILQFVIENIPIIIGVITVCKVSIYRFTFVARSHTRRRLSRE
jgi:hypothetical protein